MNLLVTLFWTAVALLFFILIIAPLLVVAVLFIYLIFAVIIDCRKALKEK